MNYLVITSNGIGGSEIRLVKCWLLIKHYHLTKNLKLILSKELYDQLLTREEFRKLSLYYEDILTHDFSDSFAINTRQLSKLLNGLLVKGDVAHVLLQYPLKFNIKGVKIIYTHPATTVFGFTNLNGILGQFYFVFKAQLIDVLDPSVFSFFRTVFFYKRHKILLTKYGVDESLFKISESIFYPSKRNDLVFLGRFVPGKQILELMNTLEYVSQYLTKQGLLNYNFVIIGQGPLQGQVERKYEELLANKVPIQLHTKVTNPYPFLLKARGFFSIQKVNNYPSQSLFEGMLAGCLPIVTNCGDTKKIAKPEFSFYIPETFSANDVAENLKSLLSLESKTFEVKSKEAIAYIKEEYSSMKMARYYSSLYEEENAVN